MRINWVAAAPWLCTIGLFVLWEGAVWVLDIAPYVRADLDRMRRDLARARAGRPVAYTNCLTGEGLEGVLEQIEAARGRALAAAR